MKVLIFLCSVLNCCSAVKFSILAEGPNLNDTLSMMRDYGCSKTAIATFRSVIEDYWSSPMELDLSRFPASKNQVYDFDSASSLVKALPHQLEYTSHVYGLNCFDATIIVADGLLSTATSPDRKVGTVYVPHNDTNGTFRFARAETTGEAFREVYSQFYRDQTDRFFRKSKSRISLVGTLFEAYSFPETTTESGLGEAVMETLQSSWHRLGVSFPNRLQVVICHQVCLPAHSMVSVHAGVLFPRTSGFTYLEKSGCKGPFVRLDCDGDRELLTWYEAMFKGASRYGYTHHFATFNGSRIARIPFTK